VKTLLILNDPAYGTEWSHNGLRLAGALARREESEVRVFLMGDAVGCAMANQQVPEGYYRRMITSAGLPTPSPIRSRRRRPGHLQPRRRSPVERAVGPAGADV
jgi:hypothetical protein